MFKELFEKKKILERGRIYDITFPHGDTCMAEYIKSVYDSFRTDEYLFRGISGDYPKENKNSEFTLQEWQVEEINFREIGTKR